MFSILHEVQIQLALLVAVLVVLAIRFVIRQIWAQQRVNAAYARLQRAQKRLQHGLDNDYEEVYFNDTFWTIEEMEQIIIPSRQEKFNKAVEQRDSIRFI